jgi:glycosyltransferase involved in cell wall biosynthesis
MWQLNPQLAVLVEDMCPGRVAYYFCGFWPIKQIEPDPHTQYWRRDETHTWVKLIKRPMGWLVARLLEMSRRRSPRLEHVACVSQFVLDTFRTSGFNLPQGRVIYGGTDLERFYLPLGDGGTRAERAGPLRLLYAGSVSPQKGVHTAVHALAELSNHYGPMNLHLTVVGNGHPSFMQSLYDFVREHDLLSYVSFRSRVAKESMPQLLREFDVLLFPSIWEEPLARMMMEGMASGLALIGTTTGGSKEILEHGHNALTFQAGNARDLADKIDRFLTDPGLVAQLSRAAQQTAQARLDFRRMVDEIEDLVECVFASSDSAS